MKEPLLAEEHGGWRVGAEVEWAVCPHIWHGKIIGFDHRWTPPLIQIKTPSGKVGLIDIRWARSRPCPWDGWKPGRDVA